MHREHAQVEQVFADLEDSALAHLPSGKFTANAAWLTLAATPTTSPRGRPPRLGLPRQSPYRNDPPPPDQHSRRIATGARRLTLHLPERWRWADDFTDLWTATGQRMRT